MKNDICPRQSKCERNGGVQYVCDQLCAGLRTDRAFQQHSEKYCIDKCRFDAH
jgi:hypothetical protein